MDRGSKVGKDMTEKLGWSWVRDCSETSIFHKRNVICVIFTDDFKLAGRRSEYDAAYWQLHKHFVFFGEIGPES